MSAVRAMLGALSTGPGYLQPVSAEGTVVRSPSGAGFSAYLDESGNTGRNYLDLDQPYYVLAGWVVDDGMVDHCRKVVENWEKALLRRGMREPKAAVLLKGDGRWERALDLFGELIACAAVPTSCIYEKEYGICTNIVETLFGVHLHIASPLHGTTAAQWRDQIASFLSSHLTKETLSHFARSFHDRNPAGLSDAYAMVRKELCALGRHDLTELMDDLPKKTSEEYALSGTNKTDAINYTVFFSELMMLECYCRRKGYDRWRLCHDETSSFESSFRRASSFAASEPPDEVAADNGFTFFFGPQCMSGMCFLRSEAEPLIRASDYQAYALRKFYEERPMRSDLSGRRRETLLAMLGVGPKLDAPLQFCTLSPAKWDEFRAAYGRE